MGDVADLLYDLYGDAGQRAKSAGPRVSASTAVGPLTGLAQPSPAHAQPTPREQPVKRAARGGDGFRAMDVDPVAATLRRGHNATVFNAALRKSHIHKLTPHDQLDATRDERIQARWEQQQADWADFKSRTSARLQRDEGSSIMSHTENYRAVQEELRLIERAAPRDEVACADDWMATLRDGGACSSLGGSRPPSVFTPVGCTQERATSSLGTSSRACGRLLATLWCGRWAPRPRLYGGHTRAPGAPQLRGGSKGWGSAGGG